MEIICLDYLLICLKECQMMHDFIRGQDVVVTSQRTGIDHKKFDLQLAGKHISCSQREIVFYSVFFRTLLSFMCNICSKTKNYWNTGFFGAQLPATEPFTGGENRRSPAEKENPATINFL